MIFLSSGVAGQPRNACGELIALLLYGFSNLRYNKHNVSDVLVYKRSFQILDIISPIPRRKNKFSTKFAAMLSLVGRIKLSLNCNPSLELHDITYAQYTFTHLFTGRISKLGLHSLQIYGCVRITSWINHVACWQMKGEQTIFILGHVIFVRPFLFLINE